MLESFPLPEDKTDHKFATWYLLTVLSIGFPGLLTGASDSLDHSTGGILIGYAIIFYYSSFKLAETNTDARYGGEGFEEGV